jgi:hypothetical protein
MLLIDLARLLENHLELSGAYPESTKHAIHRLREVINQNPNAALPSISEPLLGDPGNTQVRWSQGEVLQDQGQ